MMDLDSFKSYNDTFGHIEGDELLKNLGKILKENLRKVISSAATPGMNSVWSCRTPILKGL